MYKYSRSWYNGTIPTKQMIMTKVQITYFGKQAMVDEDQVKLLLKKEYLVNKLKAMQALQESVEDLQKTASQIIGLNRRIRKNVVFL